jgi:saccharopine dehydrogenase (NAD+, L-glutamate forming)
MQNSTKKYDIVLFGATGFTGQLIAEYLDKNADKEHIRWCIAGRNEDKLNSLSHKLHSKPDIILADVTDTSSLDAMTGQSLCLMNAAGPYDWYGRKVVESCVHNHCHYLDITGEPSFVYHCFTDFHTLAEKNQLCIVNCCGFDSIPADYATWLTVQKLPKDLPKAVRLFIRTNATFSGGTLTTAVNALHQQSRGNMPYLKIPKHKDAPKVSKSLHFNKDIDAWAIPMPVVDPHIVKRSAWRMPDYYGQAFSYGQFFVRSSFLKVLKTILPIALASLLVRFGWFRNYLLRKFRPGQGPSEKRRNESKFEVICIGEADGQKVKTVFSGGDPGYNETAKMFSESAFCLIEKLRKNQAVYGVLTPVEAFGMPLAERLRSKGIKFE